MFAIFIILHVIICIALMVSVLMQSAKGEGLAGAFGGGGGLSGAVFGGRGAATFLSRATTVLAIAFMLSCILLTFLSRGTVVAEGELPESAVTKSAGEQPAQTAPPIQVPPSGQQGTQGTTDQSGIFQDQGTQQQQQPTTTPPTTGEQKPQGSGD